MWRQIFNPMKCLNQFSQAQVQVDVLSVFALPSIQFSRNTFILKRRWPPGLHKKGGLPKKLRARHYVYDLVEDTNHRKKDNVELILTTYVKGLGDRGDKVSVKPTPGYQNLLLPGLAVCASPENVAKYCSEEAQSKRQLKHSSRHSEMTINFITSRVLNIVMNKEIPWKLEPWHVRASFRKFGVHVPEEVIEMPKEPIEGPNLDFESKEFTITITVNNLERVPVRCRIHHWSTNLSDRLPYVEENWKLPLEPLFPLN